MVLSPMVSLGQALEIANPHAEKSGKSIGAETPDSVRVQPLNSELFLKKYQPQNTFAFSPSKIGFSTYRQKMATKISEALNDEILYGNMIYTDKWADLAVYETPYGLYSFTATEGISFNPEYTYKELDCIAGVHANGKYYGIRPLTFFGGLTGIGFYIVNTNTWELEYSRLTDDFNYSSMASNMTYDPTTNKVFALRYNDDLTGFTWAELDTATFTFNNLATWSGQFSAVTLSTTPDGTIYGIATDGNLYSFDKTDGTPTLIGATGVYPESNPQSAVYSASTGKLIWFAVTYSGSSVHSVNLTTGEATKLFDLEYNEEFVGLFTKSNTAPANAPAAITDLQINFDEPGGLTGNIAFTVPSSSYANEMLTGNLHAVVKIDGTVADEQDLSVGYAYSLPFNLNNELHTFSVLISNENGLGPLAVKNQFVGYDTPTAVNNLNYSIDNGESQLTWDAVTVGINGGYIDPGLLYYKVVRMPGNEVVATDLAETSFSETMPSLMQRYYYEVTAYNGAERKGPLTRTQEIIYGDGFVPPYAQLFDDENAFEYYNIIDHNNDSNTWMKLSGTAAYWPREEDGDDWMITPAIQLEANTKYSLQFTNKSLFSPGVERMRVALGTSQTDTTTFTQQLWFNDSIAYYDYTNQLAEFSVSSSGKYYVGFYAFSEASRGSGLYVGDIFVNEIGPLQAPAQVSNLTLMPGANDALEATVSFTVPGLKLNGDVLDAISRIDVYRNNDLSSPVHSFDNPAPGSELTWHDANVPTLGYTTYTIVPVNEAGEGKSAEVTEFVGVYVAPYSETFDNADAMIPYTFLELNGENGDWVFSNYYDAVELLNYYNIVDDWMILPGIKLDAETVYEFSVDYISFGSETFDFTLGNAPNVESQQVVASFTGGTAYSFKTASTLFSTSEEGKYYPAIHLESNAGIYYFNVVLDNIRITQKGSTKAPGAVENLALTPNQNGVRQVTLSFNAPTQAYNGGSLENITSIEIYRATDIGVAHVFENPESGEALTWTDDRVPAGYIAYAIKTENEYGKGVTVIDSVYVGADIPASIEELTTRADSDNANVTLSWNTPKGKNGGYLDYNALSYKIYHYDTNAGTFNLLQEQVTDTVVAVASNVTGNLQIQYYAVSACLNGYESKPTLIHAVLGTPYQMPFNESFIQSMATTSPWVITGSLNTIWASTGEISTASGLTIAPQDNDDGMMFMYNQYGPGYGFIEIPKIKLSRNNVASNVFSFWLYQSPELATAESYIVFNISANDNNYELLGDTIRLNDGTGWTKHQINLDRYRETNYIKLRGYAYVNSFAEAFLIDHIGVCNVYPQDLTIRSISAPESIPAGDTISCYVTLENVGLDEVSSNNYSVQLFNDNELLAEQVGVDILANTTERIQVKAVPTVPEIGTNWMLHAYINFEEDQVASNNSSEIDTVYIEGNRLPTVTDLEGNRTANAIELSWNMPDIYFSGSVIESFEEQSPFAVDAIAGWRMEDVDGQYTYMVSGLDYNNASAAMAFQIWNTQLAGAWDYEELRPYSNSQCLISWHSAGVLASDGSTVEEINNDWMISPEIKAGSTIGFWANMPSAQLGNDHFEIWTSSTGYDLADFSLFKEVEIPTIGWEYYTYTLPEDAHYFAIRHVTGGLALMIDDIEYIPVDAVEGQYTLLGYNVYHNGQKLNEQLLTQTNFTTSQPDLGTYAVSVVYEMGESPLSNKVNIYKVGIEANSLLNGHVFGGKGIITASELQGHYINVYTVAGIKYGSFYCSDNRKTISLPQGIYFVALNNNEAMTKVIVH